MKRSARRKNDIAGELTMKILSFSILLASTLAATASAQQPFSVTGPGGIVPDYNGVFCATWNTQPNWPVFTSTVNVGDAVQSITGVTLLGWEHERRADIQVYLTAPNGTRYNVIVRPGFTDSACDGDNGAYLLGDYEIVQSGGATLEQGSTNISGGTYDQYLHVGAAASGRAGRSRSTTLRSIRSRDRSGPGR
jgi:hypothetical protein